MSPNQTTFMTCVVCGSSSVADVLAMAGLGAVHYLLLLPIICALMHTALEESSAAGREGSTVASA